jgi:hypothetical protein
MNHKLSSSYWQKGPRPLFPAIWMTGLVACAEPVQGISATTAFLY